MKPLKTAAIPSKKCPIQSANPLSSSWQFRPANPLSSSRKIPVNHLTIQFQQGRKYRASHWGGGTVLWKSFPPPLCTIGWLMEYFYPCKPFPPLAEKRIRNPAPPYCNNCFYVGKMLTLTKTSATHPLVISPQYNTHINLQTSHNFLDLLLHKFPFVSSWNM